MRRYTKLRTLREFFLSINRLGRRLQWWEPVTPLMLRLTLYRVWNSTEHPIRHLLFLACPWRAAVPSTLC